MAYEKINFKDRIDTKPTTYIVNGETTTIEKDNSGLKQEGSNLNAENLNHLEEGIFQNSKAIEEIKRESAIAKEITYEELKVLIEKQQLKIGGKYLLNDYATKYQQPTSSVIKTADVEPLLLTASSNNTLEPIAYSAKYPQDIICYDFNNNKCEDNKTPRKGFITKRIDTVNKNIAPGDFRGLLWIRYCPNENQYYLKDKLVNYEMWTSGEAKLGILYKSENKILIAKNTNTPKNATDSNVFSVVFDDVTNVKNAFFTEEKVKLTKDIKIKTGIMFERPTFDADCYGNDLGDKIQGLYNIVLGFSCVWNKFNQCCYYSTLGGNCSSNSFGNNCIKINLLHNCSFNTFGNNSQDILMGYNCMGNKLDSDCGHNSFLNNCDNNVFGNNCDNNSFLNNCDNNVFGNNCDNNSFLNNCDNNVFGNSCNNNSFLNDCANNAFLNNCDNNIFEFSCTCNFLSDSCDNNNLGNSCDNNSFLNNCDKNTFGNDCDKNFFGNGYCSNIFGNSCSSNTFGNDCTYNVFGNDCSENSFGNGCTNNSFGNNCHTNSFGNACKNHILGDTCFYNSFKNSCDRNNLKRLCTLNSFGNDCDRNILEEQCKENSFGNGFLNNSLEKNCSYNTFLNNISSNKFGTGMEHVFVKALNNKDVRSIESINNGFATTIEKNYYGGYVYWQYLQGTGKEEDLSIKQIP